MMEYTIDKHLKNQPDDSKAKQMDLAKQKKKLETIEEKFVIGEIDQNLYEKYRVKYQSNIDTISEDLANNQITISNLKETIEKCIQIASDLPSLWRKGSYSTKRKLQYLVFPEGIRYNRETDNYRTFLINPFFEVINCISEIYEHKKRGNFIKIDEISSLVDQRCEISNLLKYLKT